MNDSAHINENSLTLPGASGVLAEDVRREYLTAMGIQTWYDPTLEFEELVTETKISNQITSPVTDAAVINEVAEVSLADMPNELAENLSQGVVEKSVRVQSIQNPIQQIADTSALALLNTAIKECQLCELHATRESAICGEGNATADLMIVTSAPIKDESLTEDVLFSNAHKEFMQLVLQAIDVPFASVYLTSLVKCQPPEQRAPFTSEMICCDDHLSNQIKLIQPKVIMVLGESASQQLLVSQKSLTDLRLRRHQHLGVPVYASYHPQDIIGSIQTKRKVWQDLLQIKNQLNKQIET